MKNYIKYAVMPQLYLYLSKAHMEGPIKKNIDILFTLFISHKVQMNTLNICQYEALKFHSTTNYSLTKSMKIINRSLKENWTL